MCALNEMAVREMPGDRAEPRYPYPGGWCAQLSFPRRLWQESICQGGFLQSVTALKKRRGANLSWLPKSTGVGSCQGCRRQGEAGSLTGSCSGAASRQRQLLPYPPRRAQTAAGSTAASSAGGE